MAGTASINLTVSVSLSTGSKSYSPAVLTFQAPVGQFTVAGLSSGDNNVTPPTGTTAIIAIIPPTAAILKLKTVAGDAGIPLTTSPGNPTWLQLPVAASFIVNASATVSGIEVLYI